jgi:ACT domain-containing protein
MAKKKTEVSQVDKVDTKKERFLKVYQSTKTIYKACGAIGISRSCLYKWKDEDAEFAERVNEIEERVLDDLEALAIKRAKISDKVLTFMLRTKGAKRGYVEKQEVAHSGGMQIIWEETKQYDAGK